MLMLCNVNETDIFHNAKFTLLAIKLPSLALLPISLVISLFRSLIFLVKLPHSNPNLPVQEISRTLLRHRDKWPIGASP